MRLIDADVLKQHIDKLPALPDGNFAGNHSALKALINMQPTIEPSTNCSEFPNNSDTISRQAAVDVVDFECGEWRGLAKTIIKKLEELSAVQPDGIPLEWIDKHLEWLDNCDNDFAQLAKVSIKAMVELWKKDRI